MITRYSKFFICFITTIGSVYSNCAREREILLEVKGAYYGATNHLFRKIYGNGNGIAGLEVTGQLCDQWYGWIAGSILTKKGHSIGLCDPTRVFFVPVELGIKYFHHTCFGDLYGGLGLLASYLRTNDCSPFVMRHRKHGGAGGIVKAGVNVNLPWEHCKQAYLDFFADYSFIKFNFKNNCEDARCNLPVVQSHKANLSGVSLGIGIGWRF
jgi:hypothetical protein